MRSITLGSICVTRSYEFDRVDVSKPKTAGIEVFDTGTIHVSVAGRLEQYGAALSPARAWDTDA